MAGRQETDQSVKPFANRNALGHFGKGNCANPKGRTKQARDNLSASFVRTLQADFEAHGQASIEKLRKEDTATYVRVIASLVPKEMTINEGENAIERILDSLPDADLAGIVDTLRLISVVSTGGETANKAGSGKEPTGVH